MRWLHKMINRVCVRRDLSLSLLFALLYILLLFHLPCALGGWPICFLAWIWSPEGPGRRTEGGRKEEGEGKMRPFSSFLPAGLPGRLGVPWQEATKPMKWSFYKIIRPRWGYLPAWHHCILSHGFLHSSHRTDNSSFVKLLLHCFIGVHHVVK